MQHLEAVGRSDIVCKFNQSEYIAQNQDLKRNAKGVCFALSLQWVAVSAKGNASFWQYVRTRQCVEITNLLQNLETDDVETGHRIAADYDRHEKQLNQLMKDGGAGSSAAEIRAHRAALDAQLRKAGNNLDQHSQENEMFFQANGVDLRLGRRAEFKSVHEACASLVGSRGYALVSLEGDRGGHSVAAFFSDNDVRIMDPNHGELACSRESVAETGLEAHVSALFDERSGRRLGKLKKIEVELYPSQVAPARAPTFGNIADRTPPSLGSPASEAPGAQTIPAAAGAPTLADEAKPASNFGSAKD